MIVLVFRVEFEDIQPANEAGYPIKEQKQPD